VLRVGGEDVEGAVPPRVLLQDFERAHLRADEPHMGYVEGTPHLQLVAAVERCRSRREHLAENVRASRDPLERRA